MSRRRCRCRRHHRSPRRRGRLQQLLAAALHSPCTTASRMGGTTRHYGYGTARRRSLRRLLCPRAPMAWPCCAHSRRARATSRSSRAGRPPNATRRLGSSTDAWVAAECTPPRRRDFASMPTALAAESSTRPLPPPHRPHRPPPHRTHRRFCGRMRRQLVSLRRRRWCQLCHRLPCLPPPLHRRRRHRRRCHFRCCRLLPECRHHRFQCRTRPHRRHRIGRRPPSLHRPCHRHRRCLRTCHHTCRRR